MQLITYKSLQVKNLQLPFQIQLSRVTNAGGVEHCSILGSSNNLGSLLDEALSCECKKSSHPNVAREINELKCISQKANWDWAEIELEIAKKIANECRQ